MTGKEIVLNTLEFRSTPRLPVGVLDGYAWMLQQSGKSFQDLFDEAGSAGLVAGYYRSLQSDIAFMNGHVFNVVHRVMGGEVQFDRIGDAVEITKHPLHEIEEYKNFDAEKVMEEAFATPEYVSVIEHSKKLNDLLGEELLISTLSYAPFSVAGMLVGVQDFMAAMYEDEDETLALVDLAADMVIKASAKFVELGAKAVFIADPVASGDLISPSAYELFALPALKKVCAYFSALGIPVFCHICGHTEKRLEPLLDSGIAGFSMDTVDLEAALDTAYGHYMIMGNLSPFDVLLSKTPDEIRAIGAERAAVAKRKGGGYMMLPGCDLPPKTPLDNVQAMVAAAHTTAV